MGDAAFPETAFATLAAADLAVDFTEPAAALTFAAAVAVVLTVDRDAALAGAFEAGFAAVRVVGFAAAFDAGRDAVLEALPGLFDAALAAGFAAFLGAALAAGFAAELEPVFAPAFVADLAALAGFFAAVLALAFVGGLAAPRVPADFVDLLGVLAMLLNPPDAAARGNHKHRQLSIH